MEHRPGFGVMHDFRQPLPWSVPLAAYYAECINLCVEAERLGFDSIWFSEHHGTADGFLPSPLIAAAAIAARTKRVTVGTNVLVLPLHHPLRIAEDAAVVDAISGGRLILGVGQGYAHHEFELFGIDRTHRPSRLEEGVEVIRAAWRDGKTGFSGNRFQLPTGPFAATNQAPIYIGATGGPALDRAIRLGDGLLTYVGEPARASPRYDACLEGLHRHGRDPATFPFVLTSICHVAVDADSAWEQAAPGIAYLESALRPTPLGPEDLKREDYLVGTPDHVAEAMSALYAEVPFDHFAFWARLPGLTLDQASRSQRLFADEVIPSVRRS
jgi:alkanesulfonate monooxygenase SsuD/methylene tetrahydromethanopterin reductase-like flavin-dependent oxidoreductase (luciferase family)